MIFDLLIAVMGTMIFQHKNDFKRHLQTNHLCLSSRAFGETLFVSFTHCILIVN